MSLYGSFQRSFWWGAMNISELGITSEALLELARKNGYELTPRTLSDWHRYGLIPKPEREFPGHGSVSLYPLGTDTQLLALIELHSREKRLDYVGWELWWSGFPVSVELIRRVLDGFAIEWDREARYLVDPHTRQLTLWAEDAVAGAEHAPLDGVLARARKRLGRNQFPAFVRLAVAAILGRVPEDEDRIATRDADGQLILEKAFGLVGRRKVIDSDSAAEMKRSGVLKILREGSRWLRGRSMHELVSDLTDEQLLLARDQASRWLAVYAGYGPVFDWMFGRGRFFFAGLSEMARSMQTPDQAIWLMWWAVLRFRGPVLIRQAIEGMGMPTPEMLLGLRLWGAFQLVREEFPALAKLLAPRRVAAAMRDPRRQEELEMEVARFREEQAEDLDAFWQAHPEYLLEVEDGLHKQ